ncbi:hypothetical protein VK72_14560 [Paenibacillus polymyxa]|uniref:hypothetical protein n=1 Tax=Paenibacillus polymyxa TaxID=1406 RepID=UPI0009474D54|nr:hypothetical protein [Paenibacillus polymyxa]APQ59842.1 hypothetical protein VK72_14560 [Paenibacillus polymyxa]
MIPGNLGDIASTLSSLLQSGQISEADISDVDDPEAIEITAPQQVNAISELLNIQPTNPQSLTAPQQFQPISNPETITSEVGPSGLNSMSAASGAEGFAGFGVIPTQFYPNPSRAFLSIPTPIIEQRTCTKTFKILGRKFKINYSCPTVRMGRVSFFSRVTYAANISAEAKREFHNCLHGANYSAIGFAAAAYAETPGEFTVKAGAALGAGWDAWWKFFLTCVAATSYAKSERATGQMWFEIR